MNEDSNNLSIGIRARILPVIEGADALKAEISSLPTSISSRMQETISSPVFHEGLSGSQIQKVKHLAGLTTDSDEFEKLQERQKEIAGDLQIDLDRGKLTLAQQKKHLGRFAKYGQSIEGYGEFVSSELDDPRYSFLSQSQKGILRASAAQGTQEAVAGISGINEKFEQINYANEYVRNVGKLEKEQFQRHKNLEYDLEDGGYTQARGKRYLRQEQESIRKMEEMQAEAKEKFGGTEFGDRVFKTMGDDIEAAKLRMKDFGDEIEKAGKGSSNLLDNLKAAGVLSLVSTAANAGLDYWIAGKRIEAAERTSFDFSSPMGMYNQQRQFELFKENTERSRDYGIGGGIGGAIAGGLAGIGAGPAGVFLGATAGYFAGSSLLGKYAEGINTEKSGEVNEQIKRRQQVYEQLNGMVEGSSGFDILRARTRARIGNDASVLSPVDDNLGYMPEEELNMRNSFSDQRGKWDEKLYGEQTTFARAKGIDPDAIYGLNVSARMTGMDVGIGGLDKARQIATATYGESVSSQRVIDILNDLKNLNEKLLQTNVDMDSRDATRMSVIPNMIFGNDSPYGRLGEKAGDTQNILSRLGQGSGLAQEAWLYTAYGVQSPLDFLERQRKGSLDPENFAAISGKIKRESGGNKYMARLTAEGLLGWDKNIPANFVPELVDFMISGEEPTKENLDKKVAELQKKYGQNIAGYKSNAGDAVSATEKFQSEQQTITNQIGDDYRKVINKMGLDWLSTWRDLSTSTGNRIILETELNNVLGESIKRFKEFFSDGVGGKQGSEEDQYKKGKGRGRFEGPPIPEGEALEDIKKKLGRGDTGQIKDSNGNEATGWVREKMLKLQKELSESALGGRYRVNLLEGEATTGHVPGSLHYQNLAADVQLYDKFGKEKISKSNYPKEVKDFFHQFADREKISYGGDWTRPDENHFQYNKGKDNPQQLINYHELATAITNALRDQPEQATKEIIIRDKTDHGITAEHMDIVGRYANSIFK